MIDVVSGASTLGWMGSLWCRRPVRRGMVARPTDRMRSCGRGTTEVGSMGRCQVQTRLAWGGRGDGPRHREEALGCSHAIPARGQGRTSLVSPGRYVGLDAVHEMRERGG